LCCWAKRNLWTYTQIQMNRKSTCWTNFKGKYKPTPNLWYPRVIVFRRNRLTNSTSFIDNLHRLTATIDHRLKVQIGK
jgi:hypothetical protein